MYTLLFKICNSAIVEAFNTINQNLRRRLATDEMNKGVSTFQTVMFQIQVARILNVSHYFVQRMLIRFQVEEIVAHLHDGYRSMCITQA
jgi:hypothetical protein